MRHEHHGDIAFHLAGSLAAEPLEATPCSAERVMPVANLLDLVHDAFVMGNATQLHQVIMNLCSNSIHAMKAGGPLRVAITPLVYAIVTDVGGTIDVKSAPDEGSTFAIYIPQADAIAATVAA